MKLGLSRPPVGPAAGRRGADLGSKIAEKAENISLLTDIKTETFGNRTHAIRRPQGVCRAHEALGDVRGVTRVQDGHRCEACDFGVLVSPATGGALGRRRGRG